MRLPLYICARSLRRNRQERRSAQSRPMQAARAFPSGSFIHAFLPETTRKALVRRKPYGGILWGTRSEDAIVDQRASVTLESPSQNRLRNRRSSFLATATRVAKNHRYLLPLTLILRYNEADFPSTA